MTPGEHHAEADMLIGLVCDGADDWQPLAAAALVHAVLTVAALLAQASQTDALLRDLRDGDDGGEGGFMP